MADGSVRYLPPGSLTPGRLPRILEIGGCKEADTKPCQAGSVVHRRLNWSNIAAFAVWLLSVGVMLSKAVRSRKHLMAQQLRGRDQTAEPRQV